MKQSKVWTSCVSLLLICTLLFTGAAFPQEAEKPAVSTAATVETESNSARQAAPAALEKAPEAAPQPQALPAQESAPAYQEAAQAQPDEPVTAPQEETSTQDEIPAPPTEDAVQELPLFTPASAQFVRDVLCAVLTQIVIGRAEPDAVVNAIERLPLAQEQRAALAALAEEGGGSFLDTINGLTGAIGEGIHQIDITLGATPYPGVYEFLGDYVKDDGTTAHVSSGVYYDETTGLVYGKDGTGMFSIGFDYDAGQYLVVGATQAWQRQFGFCRLYDILSPLVFMNYDTVRIKFRYDNMDWMVQLWKGNYAITNGGEIGIYHKPTDRLVEFYDCAADDELPQMAMTLRKGDQVLFSRDLQPHWWMTGFQLGTLYKPAQLTLDGQLVFDDPGMRDAFVAAFQQQVCPLTSSIQVEGDLVSFSWK